MRWFFWGYLFAQFTFAAPAVYIRFDDGEGGNSFRDYSGNNNDGTCSTCPTPVMGINGRGVNFDGVNTGITLSDNASLDPTTSMTISVWIRPDSDVGDSSNPGIMAKRDAGWGGMWINDGTKRLWGRFWQSDLTQVNFAQTYTVPTDEWIHIIQMADASQSECFLYVNAAEIDSPAYNGTLRSGGSDLTIGRQNTENFDGYMDEVIIWNSALSRRQIDAIYLYQRRFKFFPEERMAFQLPLDPFSDYPWYFYEYMELFQ